MQIKSYPEPRYVRQLQGELFCLRASSPACSAPPLSIPPRTPEATPRKLWGSAKQFENHWPSLSWASQRPPPPQLPATEQLWVSGNSILKQTKWHMQPTTSPINTIKKCSPLSKAKVWAKHLRPILVPHSCEYNYVATFWDQVKISKKSQPCVKLKLISAQDQGQGTRALCLKKSALESSNFSTLESAAVRSGSGHASGVKEFLSQKKKL